MPFKITRLIYTYSPHLMRPGRDADPSPPSSAVVMKGYSYTSTPPLGRTACTEPQCLHNGALYLTVYFYTLCWFIPLASGQRK